jgi:hypothetical protein
MKPKNMPARKLRRQLRAKQPKHGKTEPLDMQMAGALAIRTKKHGTKHERMSRWARG